MSSPATAPLAPRTLNRYARGYFAASFGLYLAVFTPAMVALSFKVKHIVSQDEATAALSLILSLGALSALVASPLAGRLSDRTMSRFGRRRPWILGGAVVALGALLLGGLTTSVPLLAFAWCAAQFAVNAAFAATNATLADQIPGVQRGKVTGMVGMTSPLAILGGTLVVNLVAADGLRFALPGLVAVGLAAWFVARLKDSPRTTRPAGRFSLRYFAGSFVFNPRRT
ncbi:MFS transporter, partial [Rarobacter faecitabidus]